MLGEIQIVRKVGLRRLSLQVHPLGHIVVCSPKRISDGEIKRFIQKNESWIQKQQHKLAHLRPITASEHSELRILAQAYLPHRTMELAQELGFSYTRVSCRHQKSRWGSCSGGNSISLNIELMRLPEKLRDYIIVHELTHTVHRHHQDAFWNHLERVFPGALLLDAEMRRWKIGYV